MTHPVSANRAGGRVSVESRALQLTRTPKESEASEDIKNFGDQGVNLGISLWIGEVGGNRNDSWNNNWLLDTNHKFPPEEFFVLLKQGKKTPL